MKIPLVVGDSYSSAQEGDTGAIGGWPLILGVPADHRQGVSGSTAAQWAGDVNGMLTRAKNTECDTLIISLLGNDAFGVASQVKSAEEAIELAYNGYKDLARVLTALARKTNYVILYPDAFNRQNMIWNFGLPVLNRAIRNAVQAALPNNATFVNFGEILTPADFNGTDIHPIREAHAKIADHFAQLLK